MPMGVQRHVSTCNTVYYYVERDFSPEGFCNLDVIDAFNEIGLSKSDIRRRLKEKSIKVWDTKVADDKILSYRRPVMERELIEPDEVFLFGNPRALIVREKRKPILKRLFYKARPFVERWLGR